MYCKGFVRGWVYEKYHSSLTNVTEFRVTEDSYKTVAFHYGQCKENLIYLHP
jgi:hypothetical protein